MVEPAGGPEEGIHWEQRDQQELETWWEELTRRVLAGEFTEEPVWATDEEREARDRDGPLPPVDPCPDERRGPDESPPGDGAVVGAGWWARADRADRAVADAGAALRDAQRALGRAGRMAATARRADAADEAAWRASSQGRTTAAAGALDQLAAATAAERVRLAELLRATAGGGLADRPGLGPPGPTDGYRPGAALDRWVRARDRRCRFPGCRRRVPRGGELDHDRPCPGGSTSAGNLNGFCARHHRGKHQAPGWSYHLAPGATLTVRTPTGLVATTTPPPY